LCRVNRARQRERAGEASVLALDPTEVLLFLFLLDLTLAMDGESVVIDADVNVLLLDARNFNFQSNVLLVFLDVHRRCEAGGHQRFFRALGAIRLTRNTIHAVLHDGKFTERFPTAQYCHDALPPGGNLRKKL
jgi:hypothetical protein